MNAKMTSLFAGVALLAGVGVANAEERLTRGLDGRCYSRWLLHPPFNSAKILTPTWTST